MNYYGSYTANNLPTTDTIQLYLDGEKHCLPHLEGVVIANINSWSAGCPVWATPTEGTGRFKACRMDDKLLEVVGIYSSLHVGRIQVGLDQPLKIGQAREVKVRAVNVKQLTLTLHTLTKHSGPLSENIFVHTAEITSMCLQGHGFDS